MSIACCVEGCGASVCFTPEVKARLRRTHEWWMCPFGHQQHFTTLTEQEEQTKAAERRARAWQRRYEEMTEAFGTCPFCGWRSLASYRNRWLFLLKHFTKAHPDIIPARALMAFYKAREAA